MVNSILRVSSPSMHARVHGGIICWKYGQFIASWLHQQSNGNSFTFDNMQSSLGSLFDARSLLVDSSGAGNNWAHGHHFYGPQYRDHVLQLVRKEAEQCDSLQGFLLTHSLGGGTGSGFGTYLIALLEVRWRPLRTVIYASCLLSAEAATSTHLCCRIYILTFSVSLLRSFLQKMTMLSHHLTIACSP